MIGEKAIRRVGIAAVLMVGACGVRTQVRESKHLDTPPPGSESTAAPDVGRESATMAGSVCVPEGAYFVLLITPGPKWDHSIARDAQPGIMEHRQYMGGLFQQGVMVLGGPYDGDLGGLGVIRAGSIEEARRIANDDPGVKSGLMHTEVRRWQVKK